MVHIKLVAVVRQNFQPMLKYSGYIGKKTINNFASQRLVFEEKHETLRSKSVKKKNNGVFLEFNTTG